MNIYQLLLLKRQFFFLPEFLSTQFQNVTPSVNVFWKQYQPSFLSSGVIFTFVSVMSLNEARKSTTSPFSFFIGTISNRHQNGDPEMVIKTQINHCLMVFLWKSQSLVAQLIKSLLFPSIPHLPSKILKMSVFRFHKCLAHMHISPFPNEMLSLKIRLYFKQKHLSVLRYFCLCNLNCISFLNLLMLKHSTLWNIAPPHPQLARVAK